MPNTTQVMESLQLGKLDTKLLDIYVDPTMLSYQRERYMNAVTKYEERFGAGEISIFSAPGRSEIGGNHTDHQRGQVLAAALNVDAVAIAGKTDEDKVCVVSEGYEKISISLNELEVKMEEQGSTQALIKGVLWKIRKNGYKIGGFQAYITSDVLVGAGLSSSAAFETLITTIVSGVYNDMQISPLEAAMIGQFAENVYFGKPCGLMDQMASSVGNLVYIDFADENAPNTEKIECDFGEFGYNLCITDTKSSHADCTHEYAAVPREMKAAAGVFGKEVLGEVTIEEILKNMPKIREVAGDRAVLRTIHFFMENERVKNEVKALKTGNFDLFLENVKASGDSSFKYLQNVYMNQDIEHQNVSVALALSDMILGKNGVSRVHGGGFAGTIQAFVKNDMVEAYQRFINGILGDGACNVYRIRKYGGIKVL